MTDGVAQDQIVAAVIASSRTDARTPGHLAKFLADGDQRHRYAIRPLIDVPRTVPIDRAFSAAGSLLGCSSDVVAHRARVWRRRGSYELAKLSMSWMNGPVWPVCELDASLVGWVYALAALDFPGIFKIGFSSDPSRRLGQLQSEHKIALKLLHAVPGTRVDESIAHHSLINNMMANEWFDPAGKWKSAVPLAPFFTPERMWRSLKEAA